MEETTACLLLQLEGMRPCQLFVNVLVMGRAGILLQFLGIHRPHLDEQVEAILQRPADAVAIVLQTIRRAPTGDLRMSDETAGTGIAGGDQHDIGRVGGPFACALQSNFFLLQGLAQAFQHWAAELRQFIHKQNATMGACNLTRA